MSTTTIIAALIVFGIIVIVHEAGHFSVAKWFHVTVHEFAVGMGPKLFSKKIKETEYTIRALPLGGFVRMEGEDEESDDPNAFNKKTPLQRMGIIFAGPFMNFVLTIVLFALLFSVIGVPSNVVGSLMEDMPAKSAGLLVGDKIIAVDGQAVGSPEEVTAAIQAVQADHLQMMIERENNRQEIKVNVVSKEGRKMIGITYGNVKSPGRSIGYAFKQTFTLAKEMLDFLGKLITGKIGMSGVSGPVGIISEVGKAAKTGWVSVVALAAVISLNLGLINLMPIPALDGSRILFQLIELIRGKRIDPNKEGYVHMTGMIFLLVLMVFITYKDILRLV